MFLRPVTVLAVWLSTPIVASASPSVLAHQGRILDAAGGAINGSHDLVFSLWTETTDGTESWTETRSGMVLADGYYSLMLGEVTPLPDTVWSGDRWLQVAIDGTPVGARIRIGSVPFARLADNATGDLTPRSVSVAGITVIDTAGSWAGAPPAVAVGTGLSGDGTNAAPLALDAGDLLTVSQFNDGFGWSDSKRSLRLKESDGWTRMTNFDAVEVTTNGNPVMVQVSLQMNDDLGIHTGDRVTMACEVVVDTTRYRMGTEERYAWHNFEWMYTWTSVVPVTAGTHTFALDCILHEGSGGDFQASVGNRGHEAPVSNRSGTQSAYQDAFIVTELGR